MSAGGNGWEQQHAMRPRIPHLLVATAVVAAGLLVPSRWAWSEPQTRLSESPAVPGEVVALAHPSSHVAVTWAGNGLESVALRWRGAAGTWSAWQDVAVDHDASDGAPGVVRSGLVPVDDAVAAEVRVGGGAPAGLRIVGIDTEHGPRHLVAEHAVEPAAAETTAASVAPRPVPQPAIQPRSAWGADESIRRGTPEFAPETRMAVHHTAGAEGPDPAATIRAIYAYHVQQNGWNDIGYNFLIDSSGRIWEGRHSRDLAPGEVPTGEDTDGDGVIGAHTLNNNTGTVGVAFLGDFTSSVPTPAAMDALQRLLAWKADRHGIDPLGTTTWSTGTKSTIVGHRDAYPTDCPGQALYDRLPDVRSNVANLVASARSAARTTGYWILAKDTGVYAFGDAPFLGGPGVPAPAMSMAATPTGKGYWLLSANGHIGAYGDAGLYGSTEGMRLNAPAVRLEPTRTGLGYWVLAADGGIFSFGDAAFYGSTGNIRLNAPVVSMSTTVSGQGYWLLAQDGGVFSFGDAAFWGSTGSMRLNAPVRSMAPHPSGAGYWLQATDGGIFSFGPAVRFYGSVPGLGLRGTAPTSQIRVTPSGNGYYVLGTDGGVFTFGDAGYLGAEPGLSAARAAVDLALRNG